MKDIQIREIFEYLNAHSITYKTIGAYIENASFKFASIKQKIINGFYYAESDYLSFVEDVEGSLILTNKAIASSWGENVFIVLEEPQRVFYALANTRVPEISGGIHPTAIIDDEAVIDPSSSIGPYCVIGKSQIGAKVQLKAHVVVMDNVTIGERSIIESHSTIGATGVSWVWADDGTRVVQPQFGGVRIEKDCFIGTDVSIVRGSMSENTIIGRGTMISHGSKIGHGCIVESNCHLANNVSLAGNCKLSENVFIGSGAIISSHAEVADNSIVAAGAVVTQKFKTASSLLVGIPAKEKPINKSKFNGVPKMKS